MRRKGIQTVSDKLLHPKTKVISGVLEDECRELLVKFFRTKRQFGMN